MLEKIEDQIISKIKIKKIKPLAKTWFSLRRLGVWLLSGAFIVLGAVSIAMLITVLRFGDFDIYRLVNQNLLVFVILVFPYFWLLLYIVFLSFSFWKLRRSQYGYRYQKVWLWLSFFLASLVLGVVLEGAGLGRSIENYLADNFSGYGKINYMRGMWDNPEKGLLSGEIVLVSENNLEIKDFSGQVWQVDLNAAQVDSMVQLSLGKKIKLVGEIVAPNKFKAREVRSWGCGCAHCQAATSSSCGCGESGGCSATSCGQ
ncbi:MAG TPA: hypothetical protein PKI61_00365 [bacterium]|nr:hypothetical protein [bacterium]HPT29496.1 hypothetical protein [bacterium]